MTDINSESCIPDGKVKGKGTIPPKGTFEELGPSRSSRIVVDPKLRWLAAVTVVSYLLLITWAVNDETLRRWLNSVPTSVTAPAIEAIGRVQRVLYIGGAYVHTQVDTSTQTLLLDGAVRLALHSELEIRRQASKPALVCVVGTQQCASLYD